MTTKPIHTFTTITAVKQAAMRAYKAKRLTAQNGGACVYQENLNGKVCVCGIGASIPAAARKKLELNSYNDDNIDSLFDKGVFKAPAKIKKRLLEIQRAHDHWANSPYAEDKADCEVKFLEAIK